MIILAGGEGKRQQDITGKECPKQFFRKSSGEANMLECTFERLDRLKTERQTSIITLSKEKYKSLLDECKFRGSNKFMFEKEDCKNTAPAIFNAIYSLAEEHGESLFAFFPADHKIDDPKYFFDLVGKTMRMAERVDKIFLLGSKACEVSPELGYIVPNREDDLLQGSNMFTVSEFVEKPSRETCRELLDKQPLCNLGVFIGRASMFLESFINAAIMSKKQDIKIDGGSFDHDILPFVIDRLVVAQYSSGWSDLGISRDKESEVARGSHP